jgi:hypothetical protein
MRVLPPNGCSVEGSLPKSKRVRYRAKKTGAACVSARIYRRGKLIPDL